MEMTVEEIAKVCHEVNRAYCTAIGDFDHQAWDELSADLQLSAIQGVKDVLSADDMDPATIHDLWVGYRAMQGWTYGDYKDELNKKHPMMIPFMAMPVEQQIKDHLFIAIVKALK